MFSKDKSANFGFILFKIGDIGPELISYENIPSEIEQEFDQKTSIELGIYISLVVSQGKGINKEGLFGPLPWYRLPEHELFIFSFLAKDLQIADIRKKENMLLFLVVLFHGIQEALMHSRYEIQKSMEQLYIRPLGKRIILNDENIFFIMDSSKDIFTRSFISGNKLLQEEAIDEVIDFESMEQFALYSLKNFSLKTTLIGIDKELPTKDFFTNKSEGDYQISVRDNKNGSSSLIIEFKEIDMVIYIKLNHKLKSQTLIRLLSKIDTSLDTLASYV